MPFLAPPKVPTHAGHGVGLPDVDLEKTAETAKQTAVDLKKTTQDLKKKVDECEPSLALPQAPRRRLGETRCVEKRVPRKYTKKDLHRIAKYVLRDGDECDDVDALAAVAAAIQNSSHTPTGTPLSILTSTILFVDSVVDLYETALAVTQMSNETAWIHETQDYFKDSWLFYLQKEWGIDILTWIVELLDFLEAIITLPHKIVLMFSPIAECARAISEFLTMMKEKIEIFVT